MATLKQEFIFFNDEDGRIRPNAKMKFFEAGTNTPKATYTTVDLTSPNPWPVIASGDGIFPPIFLETGGYKIEVYDQNDVLIRTRDNINVAEATILSTSDLYFSTLIDAKQGISINGTSIDLQVGQIARTAGKNTVDDGEGAEWLVVAAGTGTADDDLYADLDNSKQLKRLFNQLYTKNKLSEIADAGASAQSDARDNIDVYSTTEVDALTTPVAVSGYDAARYIYNISDGSPAAGFDVDSTFAAEGEWYSIGPTGSGADYTWTALDALLSDTKFVRVLVLSSDISFTGAGSRGATCFARPNGSSKPAGDATVISNGIGWDVEGHAWSNLADIPLDSNNVFEAYYTTVTGSGDVGFSIKGFGV